MFTIRPLIDSDIPHLIQINPTFIAHTALEIQAAGSPPFSTWTLREVALDTPFDKGAGYDFDPVEQKNIQERFHKPNTFIEVVEETQTGRLVGILDMEEESWRYAAWVWNLMLDVRVRGNGLGRRLHSDAIDWARKRRLRAVMLETQSNNTPACHFYAHLGYQLIGINTLFYTNRDIERGEVALFWGYTL